MYLAENLIEKWGPVLNHESLPEIKDHYKKTLTAVLLENQGLYKSIPLFSITIQVFTRSFALEGP